MPALVHALVVARATRTPSDASEGLRRTLEAIGAQTRPVDALTVVACGDVPDIDEIVQLAGAEGLVQAPDGTAFAAAVGFGHGRVAEGQALWLLTQDTEPEPTALAQLAGALERGPSVAIAAPKLVSVDDRSLIVSLGVSMTRLGRTVPLAGGELDQGQHDSDDDVLGADVRGLLIRHDLREALLPDIALMGVDEGLDLGVRARLAGRRVAMAPTARIAVGDANGLPKNAVRRAYVVRTAQLHRRLTYAPAVTVALHWLSLLPLALWRTLGHLVAKQPARVPAEWAAAVTAMVRLTAVARSRSRIRENRESGWDRIRPLRATAGQLRERYGGGPETADYGELGFFSGGGAWAVLGALAVSVAAFFSLLAWPSIGGGALLPLRATVSGLWHDALYGVRPIGLAEVTAADPFSAVIALIGTAWPVGPSYTMVVLWLLALPLAVLGGWFAATRVSDRAGVRSLVAVLYGLSPALIAALIEGRPAALLAHLLLPWLFYAGAVAHRSWSASGAASILLLAVLACAPSLSPALAVLWAIALVLAVIFRARHGIARIVWLVVPTVVWFAPIVITQLRRGTPLAVFADPGAVTSSDPVSRWLLAAGFPTADPGGWGALTGGATWWVPLLVAPVALLAVIAPLTARWRAATGLLLMTVTGIATAFAAGGLRVSFDMGDPVAIWQGTGLSLAWLGAIGAAAIALDTAPVPNPVRVLSGLAAAACVAVLAVPGLTAVVRGEAAIESGHGSTLPAYVGAEASGDQSVGTLVLRLRTDGTVATETVWGESETLGGKATLQTTDTGLSAADRTVARLAADLISSNDAETAETLRQNGVRYVLLAATEEQTDLSRAGRLEAVTAIDQRESFARVGETARGVLWRLDADPEPRADLTAAQQATATAVMLSQGAVLLVALLLAIPTTESRRSARVMPRIVGGGYEEERP